MDGVVRGPAELNALGRRFKAAGSGGLRRALTKRLDVAMAKLRPAIKSSALSSLPRSGGLAALVARSSLTVTTVGTGAQLIASGPVNLAAINAGRLSHPVFGKPPNVTQGVTPGYFDKPAKEHERDIAQELGKGLDDVGHDISGHL